LLHDIFGSDDRRPAAPVQQQRQMYRPGDRPAGW
jgi:hypothetical protein